MAYTEVAMLTADSAKEGDVFPLYVIILNKTLNTSMEGNYWGQAIIYIDGKIVDEGKYDVISPNTPGWFMSEYGLMYKGSLEYDILMPDHAITIKVEAWIENDTFGIPWHVDSTASKTIKLDTESGNGTTNGGNGGNGGNGDNGGETGNGDNGSNGGNGGNGGNGSNGDEEGNGDTSAVTVFTGSTAWKPIAIIAAGLAAIGVFAWFKRKRRR